MRRGKKLEWSSAYQGAAWAGDDWMTEHKGGLATASLKDEVAVQGFHTTGV